MSRRPQLRTMRAAALLLAALLALAPVAPASPGPPPGPPAVPATQDGDTRVYLDKPAALRYVFPGASRVVELRHLLTAEETAAVESLTGQRLEEGGFFIYAALLTGSSEPTAYAVIVAEVGKVLPITHIVGVTPAGAAGRVAVMIYRESHGADVASERFMDQYAGKTLADPIRVDKDIINVAGSTLSAHAICRGVRKALAVVKVVLLDRDPAARAALLAGGAELELAAAAESVPGAAADRSPAEAGATAGRVRAERQVMGTLCSIEARGDADGPDDAALAAAVQAGLDEVTRWDGVLSDWRDDTALARLNAAPADQPFPLDDDLLAWLLDCRQWVDSSGGAFDPTVGALVAAWGLRTQQPGRPGPEQLLAARASTGFERLRLDAAARTARRSAGLLLDPGASGKGWALDRAADVLRARGVRRALLSFRSTLVALGAPPGADGWLVPVVHDGSGATVAEFALRDASLSVSGGALAAFDDGGVERGHVIDPASGVPVEAGRLAWVLAPTGAGSDALCTALLVRGPSLPAVAGCSGGFMPAADAAPASWPAHP